MVKWRHAHARMVERIIGRRSGTGGSSGNTISMGLLSTVSSQIFGL